jgi:outer membrane receptor protein involved in Fe transport
MQLPRLKPKAISIAACSVSLMTALNAYAGALNTEIPVTVNLPAQPLAESLKQYAKQTGKNIVFDNSLAKGKLAPAIKGSYDESQTLKKILENTGLEANVEDNTIVIKRARVKVEKSENIQLDTINVRAKRFYEIGPLPGLGLTKDQIPGNVQSITAKEIKDSHSLSITDLMNKKLQSVTVNDYQGNPFQMDVQYRGFTAGPQIGTPQGLSVFFDGIRVNEPFGDVVNWDMIPMNALAGVDVFPGSNPIFGLGTLGGAFAVKTKDGFNNTGVDADVLTGSFGRRQFQAEGGWNNGTIGLFAAGNFFLEDGWRNNSPSEVNQLFTKASYRGDKLDLNLSSLVVANNLVGNGMVPTNFYEQNRRSVFTSPDETKNRLSQFQLSGSYFVSDNFTVTGQVYRRNSRRRQITGDAYTDYEGMALSQNFADGQEFTCKFMSTNQYGLPDYVRIDIPDPNDLSSSPFLNALFNTGVADMSLLGPQEINSAEFLAAAKSQFAYYQNPTTFIVNDTADGFISPIGAETSYSNSEISYFAKFDQMASDFARPDPSFPVDFGILSALSASFYYTPDGVKHLIAYRFAVNGEACYEAQQEGERGLTYNPKIVNDRVVAVDGLQGDQPGEVVGIPTAVITDNQINQKVDGASLQLNWNLEKHKFMVGASIDKPYSEYLNSQRLGFFDAKRNAYLDPDGALDVFRAADVGIENNDFSGTSTTQSLYASETWSPVETLHITGALRYNKTKVNTTFAARDFGGSEISLADYLNYPNDYALCPDPACDIPTGYQIPFGTIAKYPEKPEKFSYYSLNPSLGLTWQAKENLNLYVNWAQGTRTPSVIELGCALDKTPVKYGVDSNGNQVYIPRSVANGRSCQLPSALSGDPYLPQVEAQTYDIGARGRWGEMLEWNLGYYRTELKNDIYMVTYFGNQNFFDTIGRTRRQGVEMGLNGNVDKFRFGLNYALNDAKFRSTFVTGGEANSSATPMQVLTGGEVAPGMITVRPGDRMPGVSLHNLNASVNYDVTDKWSMGLSAVAHSWTYLRGNENNKHRPGVPRPVVMREYDANLLPLGWKTVYRQPSSNPGKLPGYTVFNFQTSYKFNKEWTATMLINNVFDKEYFSAGRLGVNPFSPSINGAIGPDGYNHNSGDWLTTNFIAPGAPRGVWFSLNWQFDPNSKPSF